MSYSRLYIAAAVDVHFSLFGERGITDLPKSQGQIETLPMSHQTASLCRWSVPWTGQGRGLGDTRRHDDAGHQVPAKTEPGEHVGYFSIGNR